MKNRIFSLLLALTLCLGLAAPAAAAGGSSPGLRDSGSASVDKLSREEIVQLLEDNPLTLPDEVFEEAPSCTAPYEAGTVKPEVLQAATDRLNALRQIAGLPAVRLDLELSAQAQYGAVIQGALGTLNHYPSKPAGMDDSFYQAAKSASSSSNLSAGRTLTGAVDGFMNDSDASNIDRVGHRRWQLNPQLGKIGLGYAESSTGYGRYVAEKVFDRSGTCTDYDFVAWPASGSFPSSHFGGNTAWSVSLNPAQYSTPRQSDLIVTLTRERDGRTWTFQGSDYTASGSGAYFHVDTGGYGIDNCIIFRPDGVDLYEGVYTVEIDGLRTKSGAQVQDFAYQVDFFDPDALSAEPEQPEESDEPEQPDEPEEPQKPDEPQEPGQPERPQPISFSDVPAGHWAYDFVAQAVEEGWIAGYGDGTFGTDDQVTYAQLSTMLVQAFFPQSLTDHPDASGAWYEPYCGALAAMGLYDGTRAGRDGYADAADRPVTRCEMAQLLSNVLWHEDAVPRYDSAAVRAGIADWDRIGPSYREAVACTVAAGLISGVDDRGTFSGDGLMTRAQAAVVLTRLSALL